MLDKETKRALLASQRDEITEHLVYTKFSHSMKDPHNNEMALISLGIAALTFGIGFLIRIFFQIEI